MFRAALLAGFTIISCPTLYGQHCVTSPPPEGAIVLFDGKATSAWRDHKGEACDWPIVDGAMVVTKENAYSKDLFTSYQLHLEFRTPQRGDAEYHGGNSGVYLHGDYEIQVLDKTKGDRQPGSCGGIYSQFAPLVDASLPAPQWQSYDILFHAPLYEDGKLLHKARISVIHNGVWIHDNREAGVTPGGLTDNHKESGPLMLQSHGSPVRYRNIWIRPLGNAAPTPAKPDAAK